MTSWSISPTGVQSVLASVQVSRQELATATEGLSTAHGELLGGLGDLLATVGDAAAGFLESQGTALVAVAGRIDACGTGVVEATTAYVTGDEDMAATAQAAAVAAAADAPAVAAEAARAAAAQDAVPPLLRIPR